MGATLPVLLDEGEDLNAYYDRKALNFFHGPLGSGLVYSGESPDVLCHEMGHAILDTVKPGLWDAAAQEIPAFHESFGDMSAILSGSAGPVAAQRGAEGDEGTPVSQLPPVPARRATRHSHPGAGAGCGGFRSVCAMRSTRSPIMIRCRFRHRRRRRSFHRSRIRFRGYSPGPSLKASRGCLTATAKSPKSPTEAELQAVSHDMGNILLAAVRQAPIVANFYSQVATAMVQAAQHNQQRLRSRAQCRFVRRSILSLQSASAIGGLSTTVAAPKGIAAAATAVADEPPLARIALDGNRFGLGNRPILVTYSVTSAKRVCLCGGFKRRAADASQR